MHELGGQDRTRSERQTLGCLHPEAEEVTRRSGIGREGKGCRVPPWSIRHAEMQEAIGTSQGEAHEEFLVEGGTCRNKQKHICSHYRVVHRTEKSSSAKY